MFDMGMGADMMGMGAMDMGIGAMDMQIGAMDMAMGNPIGGMEMMALGQMDMAVGQMDMAMAMGQNLMGMGIMEAEMGMMGPMGMGGMGGIGGIGGMAPMGGMGGVGMGGVGMGGVGFGGMRGGMPMRNQIVQRPMGFQQYSPNMTQQQQMMIQQPRVQQQGQMRYPPGQQGQIPYSQPQQNQVPYRAQQVPQGQVPQPSSQQNLEYAKQNQREQEQMLIVKQQSLQQQKQRQAQQQQIQAMNQRDVQQKMRRDRKELAESSLEKQRSEIIQPEAKGVPADQQLAAMQTKSQKFLPQNMNPYNPQQPQLLFVGRADRLNGSNWQPLQNASITMHSFIGIPINAITKVKVKAESRIPGTRLLKISTNQSDFFFSVAAEQQSEWMTKLIWAKLTSMGCTASGEYFQGVVDGPITKKSFFGGWEPKIGLLTGSLFKILPYENGAPEKTVSEVSEIWTRFQMVHNNLVVKMHTFGKLQVGVPVDRAICWMQGLHNLIK